MIFVVTTGLYIQSACGVEGERDTGHVCFERLRRRRTSLGSAV